MRNHPDRIVRQAELRKRLGGISKPTVYRMIRRGELPPSLRISAGVVGWRESTLNAWLAAREREAEERSQLAQR